MKRLNGLILVLVLAACSSSKEAASTDTANAVGTKQADDALDLPPVDPKAADSVREALAQVDPEMRGAMAAMALAELEKGRLPDSFIEGLEAIAQAPPDMRSALLARSLSESMPMLNHLCTDGVSLMRSVSEMAPEQRTAAVFEGCGMEKHGLVTREELGSRDAMMLLMGHLALDHLTRAGELHAGERAAIEALAGAGRGSG